MADTSLTFLKARKVTKACPEQDPCKANEGSLYRPAISGVMITTA
jgi:hypothetical protein